MKRELFILRHGKSDWTQPVADFQRPLKKRGRKNARQVGAWLAEKDLIPEYIISSPAVRALETARLVSLAMQFPEGGIHQELLVYGAGVPELLQVIQQIPESVGRALLVGHNPGFEELVRYLAAEEMPWPEDGKLMPTAALARFRVQCVWPEINIDSVQFIQLRRPRHKLLD